LSTLKSALMRAGLSAQLTRALTARGGFPCHRGAKQPHRAVFLHQLGVELACLGSCALMSAPSVVKGEGLLAPQHAWSSS
jgi:hypothetical protein